MKINSVKPISGFLSTEKDIGIIIGQMMNNERLKKLLYYTTRDCLIREKISEEQTLQLIQKNILLVPKIPVNPDVRNYIAINCDGFAPNVNNSYFRDNLLEFDIICHFDQWALNDYQLRPYKIAGEIDMMFSEKHLSGIGKLNFVGATQQIYTEEFAGLCLLFRAIHGDEDKINMPTPQQEEQFLEDFQESIQNKES